MIKVIVTALVLGVLVLGIWAGSDFWPATSEVTTTEAIGEQENAVFHVTGMTCTGCEAAVKIAVKRLDGIHQVEASYKEGKAVVAYEPSKVSPEEIKAAINKAGYKAEIQSKEGLPR